MKLKEFNKVNIATRTFYILTYKDKSFDILMFDYLDDDFAKALEIMRLWELNKNIEVKYISQNKKLDCLTVSLEEK